MPSNMLHARFENGARTVDIAISGPWWPSDIYAHERDDDKQATHAVYEVIRKALRAELYREVEL